MIPKKKAKNKKTKKTELQKEIQEIEQWIIERKRFLIKLAWTTALIIFLIILSNKYLKVVGVGI